MERREFIQKCIMVVVGASVPLSALTLIDPKKVFAENLTSSGRFWLIQISVSAAVFA